MEIYMKNTNMHNRSTEFGMRALGFNSGFANLLFYLGQVNSPEYGFSTSYKRLPYVSEKFKNLQKILICFQFVVARLQGPEHIPEE